MTAPLLIGYIIAGAVLLVVGLAGLFGALPLAVGAVGGGGGHPPPTFLTVSGQTVTVSGYNVSEKATGSYGLVGKLSYRLLIETASSSVVSNTSIPGSYGCTTGSTACYGDWAAVGSVLVSYPGTYYVAAIASGYSTKYGNLHEVESSFASVSVPSKSGGGTGGSGCGPSGCPSLTVNFVYNATGLSVKVHDASTTSNGAKVTGYSYSWGDGNFNPSATGNATHVYVSAGKYVVTESVTATNGSALTGGTLSGSTTQNVTVMMGTNSSGNSSNDYVPPSTITILNVGLVGAGLGIFLGLIPPARRTYLPAILGAIGLGVGTVVAFILPFL